MSACCKIPEAMLYNSIYIKIICTAEVRLVALIPETREGWGEDTHSALLESSFLTHMLATIAVTWGKSLKRPHMAYS